jgi:hypothetical protein
MFFYKLRESVCNTIYHLLEHMGSALKDPISPRMKKGQMNKSILKALMIILLTCKALRSYHVVLLECSRNAYVVAGWSGSHSSFVT